MTDLVDSTETTAEAPEAIETPETVETPAVEETTPIAEPEVSQEESSSEVIHVKSFSERLDEFFHSAVRSAEDVVAWVKAEL